MARYTRDSIIGNVKYGTTDAIDRVRFASANGSIRTRTMVMTYPNRLDTIAGALLGDSSLWWVIAALSGIGWGLQVPAGTRLTVPVNREAVEEFI